MIGGEKLGSWLSVLDSAATGRGGGDDDDDDGDGEAGRQVAQDSD